MVESCGSTPPPEPKPEPTCNDGKEARKEVKWEKPENPKSPSWNGAKAYAESKGGRLMTVDEVREFIKNANGNQAIYPGEDAWVAVARPNNAGIHDWI